MRLRGKEGFSVRILCIRVFRVRSFGWLGKGVVVVHGAGWLWAEGSC